MKYVLVTPARNEAAFIEKTILSVICQTVLPEMWVIVSDASTDSTDDIIKRYSREHPWIRLIRLEQNPNRHFASKVRAFNSGFEAARGVEYDIVGNVDADISFGEDYMEFLLERFQEDPRLGVAGTDYLEGDFHSFRDSYISENHVNGQIQLFRRQCFDEIGGYTPIRHGGIDWVAVTTARMLGWKTRSFSQRTFTHLRKMGSEGKGTFRVRFDSGRKDYFLGNHPLWEIVRGVFQMKSRPVFLGGLSILAGYFSCVITRKERPISKDLVRFNRKEQMARLKTLLMGGPGIRGRSKPKGSGS